MLKKNDKNQPQNSNPLASVSDPWEPETSVPHFPSPLELDRLLRPEHLLISSAPTYPAISSIPIPAGFLIPSCEERLPLAPTEILLEHELKLPSPLMDYMKAQVSEALALLYWLVANPSWPKALMTGGGSMKSGKLLAPNATIPEYVQVALKKHFPGRDLNDLSIRYYSSVEDVGYDYFMKRVVPDAMTPSLVHYLAPFISFVRLGEALILDQDVLIVYETDGGDGCTETGPFWAVFPEVNASLLS